MSLADLAKALSDIAQRDDGDFVGPRSDNAIAQAESALGLAFPEAYRRFLAALGCGDIGGHEFFGLVREDGFGGGIPDVVWITLAERKDSSLPEHLLLVHETGDCGYDAIDCSDSASRGSVVRWVPGLSGKTSKLERVAEDFGAFLLTTLS